MKQRLEKEGEGLQKGTFDKEKGVYKE